MSVKVPFNGHEAVLLLDAYLSTLDGKITQTEAVKRCSRDLRQMAINKGYEIDATYRSERGIMGRIFKMQSAYRGENVPKMPKIFKETVNLYRNNRQVYDKILKEAKAMLDNNKEKDSKVLSSEWLSDKVPESRFSVEVSAPNNLDDDSDEEHEVNFSHLSWDSLTYTKPNRLVYFGDVHYVSNWTDVFVKACSLLYEDYPRVFQDCRTKYLYSYNRHGMIGVTDEKNKGAFFRPVKIADDYYLEGNRSSSDLMATLKRILDRCHVNYENVSIFYGTKNNQPARTRLHRRPSPARGNLDFTDASVYINSESQIQSGQAEILDENMSVSTVSDEVSAPNDFDDASDEEYKVDFSHLSWDTLTYTKPKRLVYFGDVYYFDKWIDLFIKACSLLYEDYPRIFQEYRTEYLYSSDRYALIGVADEKNMNELPKPVKIAEDYYLNGKKSSSDLMITLRKIMDRCLVDYENVSVFYVPRNRQSTGTGPHRRQSPARENLDFADAALVNIDTAPYIDVMNKYFPKGYRLGSKIAYKRFSGSYEELNGSPLDCDSDTLDAILRNIGVIYKGVAYSFENMLKRDVRDKLLSRIDELFIQADRIYLRVLYDEFSDEFLDSDSKIYNSDMLKAYLSHLADKKFVVGRSYIEKYGAASTSPIEEVRNCLREHGMPMRFDEIVNALPNISREKIKGILSSNREFVRNRKGEYFHGDCLALGPEELETIAGIIDDTISEQQYMTTKELMDVIKRRYPKLYEQYDMITAIGWRDALKYKLDSRFSFEGNIISAKGRPLTAEKIFEQFGASRDEFTLDELDSLARELHASGGVRFNSLYKNATRVSYDNFVSKDKCRFNVAETDAVLDGFCTGKYMPLSEFKQFAILPEAFMPWNEFLLEQYIAFFSGKYYLEHNDFKQSRTMGAMVKREHRYASYSDFLSEVLADCDVDLNKESALNYLFRTGYIAQRSFAGIENILIESGARRNRRGNQSNVLI